MSALSEHVPNPQSLPPATPSTPSVLRGSWISALSRLVVGLLVVAIIAGYTLYFQVPESTSVVVVRFGNPVREITQPGPYFKWPWPIEQVRQIDMRQRIFNTPFTATFTRDRKNVILLSYVVWRTERPLFFLQSVGTVEAAERKLDGMVTAAKNFHLGKYDLTSLVSTDPHQIQTGQIEAAILKEVRGQALEKFGIAIEQVGIKRIAYPEENVKAVLAQMRAERKAEADRLRAEGEKEARRIRDEALVRSEELLRDGREQSGKIRGEAEKVAAEVYASAHRLDPDFYRFWRQLETLKKTLGSKATVVLRTDQGPFELLTHPPETGIAPRESPGRPSRKLTDRNEP